MGDGGAGWGRGCVCSGWEGPAVRLLLQRPCQTPSPSIIECVSPAPSRRPWCASSWRGATWTGAPPRGRRRRAAAGGGGRGRERGGLQDPLSPTIIERTCTAVRLACRSASTARSLASRASSLSACSWRQRGSSGSGSGRPRPSRFCLASARAALTASHSSPASRR